MTELTERVARLEGAYEHLATKADIAELRTDMAELKAELRTDMAKLEAELKTDMAKLEADLTEKIGKKINTVAAVTVAVIGILQLVLKFFVP